MHSPRSSLTPRCRPDAAQQSTGSRLTWLTTVESLFVVVVSVLQVLYIKRLIERRRWV